MNTESEAVLEEKLLQQLQGLGYAFVRINNEAELVANFKTQLEKHNNVSLSNDEFKQILNYIKDGNVFEKSKRLKERILYKNEAGENKYLQLYNAEQWCKNEFQVTHQTTNDKGIYENRYDVIILINGLPLVLIELKRRGAALKDAFAQIKRYAKHSLNAGLALFGYTQLFVISNGVNTKYYSNGPYEGKFSFQQTFYWTDEANNLITRLEDFADAFMNPCHLSKMIGQYIVQHEQRKCLMVLRPYQYYAVEGIIHQVKQQSGNGYIWHTTGSGKTLTSFKAAQILTKLPNVDKVMFVVDRKDLDYQTAKEFNNFSEGSIHSTSNTNALLKHFKDANSKLIVTTIQKLNNAVSSENYKNQIKDWQDKSIVFIFDECHRSQFGDAHKHITGFFRKAQIFGFTGTPIFAENATMNEHGKRTTAMLFRNCLHKYVITDAIRDENVLRFAIDYISTFKSKEDVQDIEVERIDEEEVMNSAERRNLIVQHIIQTHNYKTHNKEFTAMFCVSKVEAAVAYYEIFKSLKEKGKHNLKIATIFTYIANEEDKEKSIGREQSEEFDNGEVMDNNPTYAREHLDRFMQDYNGMFGTNYNTRDSKLFYNYSDDISKRVRERQIDILIVVNMFLTGFDSPYLNTLYVDKNLQYHGLIQAYSRTNRLKNEKKSHGNIVCYRNLKKNTDEAIKMFANKEAIEDIIAPPYEKLLAQFVEKVKALKAITPTVDDVNTLPHEEAQGEFIEAFKGVMRLMNKMKQYNDFDAENLDLPAQEFEEYKSKYLDLYEQYGNVKKGLNPKHSILSDINFEIELIHRDEVNLNYIMSLLMKLQSAPIEEKKSQEEQLYNILDSNWQWKSKKKLIELFIKEHLLKLDDNNLVISSFEKFMEAQREFAMQRLIIEEKLYADKFQAVLENYLFNGMKVPLTDELVAMCMEKPSLMQKIPKGNYLRDKLVQFVDTYYL